MIRRLLNLDSRAAVPLLAAVCLGTLWTLLGVSTAQPWPITVALGAGGCVAGVVWAWVKQLWT